MYTIPDWVRILCTMENLILSEIEEGEILEQDFDSPRNTEIKTDIYNFQDEFSRKTNIANGGYVNMPGLKEGNFF